MWMYVDGVEVCSCVFSEAYSNQRPAASGGWLHCSGSTAYIGGCDGHRLCYMHVRA